MENVLFTILNVPRAERDALEEKRARSYFYYNLWYNAKAFLSSRLYGSTSELENTEINKTIEQKENNLNFKGVDTSEKIEEKIEREPYSEK